MVVELSCHVVKKNIFWELISWYNKFIRVDLVRVDLERIDLVGVDLVRVDLVRPNRGYYLVLATHIQINDIRKYYAKWIICHLYM